MGTVSAASMGNRQIQVTLVFWQQAASTLLPETVLHSMCAHTIYIYTICIYTYICNYYIRYISCTNIRHNMRMTVISSSKLSKVVHPLKIAWSTSSETRMPFVSRLTVLKSHFGLKNHWEIQNEWSIHYEFDKHFYYPIKVRIILDLWI